MIRWPGKQETFVRSVVAATSFVSTLRSRQFKRVAYFKAQFNDDALYRQIIDS